MRLLDLPKIDHHGVRARCSCGRVERGRTQVIADHFGELPAGPPAAAAESASTVAVSNARVLPVFEDGVVLPVIDICPQDVDGNAGKRRMALIISCTVGIFFVHAM